MTPFLCTPILKDPVQNQIQTQTYSGNNHCYTVTALRYICEKASK